MYIVKSPVEGYSGISAGVQFKDGVGTTDNPNAAAWLRSKGYEVAEAKAAKPEKTEEPPKAPEDPKSTEPPKDKGGNTKGGKK